MLKLEPDPLGGMESSIPMSSLQSKNSVILGLELVSVLDIKNMYLNL